jgi:catechol 2,3-dioxygenase-like lactoylglutathione lyase family enzyme
MAIRFNHTILPAKDAAATARFVAELLGVLPTRVSGRFHVVDIADEATIDYVDHEGDAVGRHVAFLVSDEEFDAIYARIRAGDVPHWADPRGEKAGEINHLFGGRGVYFRDPGGNYLECITRPYAK